MQDDSVIFTLYYRPQESYGLFRVVLCNSENKKFCLKNREVKYPTKKNTAVTAVTVVISTAVLLQYYYSITSDI